MTAIVTIIRVPAPLRRVALMCPLVMAAPLSTHAAATLLPPITVSAPASRGHDEAASIDVIDAERVRAAQARINLSETLSALPGVVANTRQNYAQELQISIRGFGARSTFGLRGIRIYADGIPLTMPDGQGQVANVDLTSTREIEVLRGPYSSLYGNASGGVIQITTEDGPARPTLAAETEYGRFALRRIGLKGGGQSGVVNYLASGSRDAIEGFRVHSAARRDLTNAKLRADLDDRSSLSIIANYLDSPEAEDPLGLDRDQLAADRRQTGTYAVAYNSRKSFSNRSGGLVYENALSGRDHLRLMTYVGGREVRQFLVVSAAAQAAPTSAGGGIDLDRSVNGVDARWLRTTLLGGRALNFIVGINYEALAEQRKGYNNFDGAQLGVIGVLRRDENNHVFNVDQYLQVENELGADWVVNLGVRHSRVLFQSKDYFLANGNDSGAVVYRSTDPKAAVLYRVRPALNLYASVGRGFELPAFNELAYRLGEQGLNFDLWLVCSRLAEVGAKWLIGASRLNAALFDIDTHDDLAVLQNAGGRAVYQNVGHSRRHGAELAYERRLPYGFNMQLSYTYLDARITSPYRTCQTVPCMFPAVNTGGGPAGRRRPGGPARTGYGELAWTAADRGMSGAVELRALGRLYTNDINDEWAPGYGVLNARGQWRQVRGDWTISEFARLDNLLDHRYVGSVIVNEANGRYYEPAPGRTWLIGVNAAYAF